MAPQPAIEVSHVTKYYRRYSQRRQFSTLKSALLSRTMVRNLAPDETFLALSDVSFSVPAGATYGVIGRNGSGKSTALKVVAGITKPNEGTVHVGLSKSLRAEAAEVGIRVSVICPGVIRTPILEGGGKYGKMLIDIPPEHARRMWEKRKPMSPNVFAEKVLNSVARNKAIIIVPSWWNLFWWVNRLSPSLGISLSQKRFQKMQKELGIVQRH